MLFLDLDGTALKVRQRHYAAYTGALDLPDVRGVPIPEKEYWGLRVRGEPWAKILKRSRLLPTRYAAYQAAFQARLEAPELLGLDEPVEGLETFLGKVYTKTPIVLVTQRRDGGALERQLTNLNLRKYFVEVLHGVPPERRRPDPTLRARHKAALVRARYRLPPTESLWVGDTETDVGAARDLGFDVWLVEGGHRTKALQIKSDPDRIVAHLPGSLEFMLAGGRWTR